MDDTADDVGVVVRAVQAATGIEATAWRDPGGSFTTNLALQTGDGTVVARVHPATTPLGRVGAEQEARRALAAAGLPTVVAWALTQLPDGRHVELEPYVDAHDRMKTPARLTTGFTLLARIHDVLRTSELPEAAQSVEYANHVDAEDAATVTAAAADRLRAGPRDLARFAAVLVDHVSTVAALEESDRDHHVVHLTHGDFWDNNVLFDSGEVAAVLDFGFMASRARIDDLALPFWFWLLEPGHACPARTTWVCSRDSLTPTTSVRNDPSACRSGRRCRWRSRVSQPGRRSNGCWSRRWPPSRRPPAQRPRNSPSLVRCSLRTCPRTTWTVAAAWRLRSVHGW